MSFKHWSISWTIVSLLLLLGLISLGGSLYASLEMGSIARQNLELAHGPSSATVAAAKANRAVVATVAAIYQHIVATTDAGNRIAIDAEKAAITVFDENVDTAIRLYPNFSQKLGKAKAEFHVILDETCKETRRLADSTDQQGIANASAEMLKICQPAFTQLSTTLISTMDDLAADVASKTNVLFDETTQTAWTVIITIVLGTLAIVIGAVFVVRRAVVRPLHSMMAVMQALGRGELDTFVPNTDRGNEVGSMSKALEQLRSQLWTAASLSIEQACTDELAKGQLVRREALAQNFVNRMQALAGGFADLSGEVATAASSLSASAIETSRQAHSVAEAAEKASENVQSVATSSEQLAASVREITAQVAHSSEVADAAYSEAESSNARIVGLTKAAAAIGDVVILIRGIAGQTNLLALNATIEAARAGDAGRGFAIVASEVKQLAEQTSRATDEIGAKIDEIQSATAGAVNSMTEIARTILNVKTIATSIAGAVEEQGAATGEIAINCNFAAQGAAQVTQNITGVGQAAELTGSASAQLTTLSSGLSTQAADLRKVVETFVQELSAA